MEYGYLYQDIYFPTKDAIGTRLRRGVLKKVLIPEKNQKDLEEVPSKVIKGLELVFVGSMENVLSHTFVTGFSK